MTALAMSSDAQTNRLSKNDLARIAHRAAIMDQSPRARLRKHSDSAKHATNDDSTMFDEASIGTMMESIQTKITARPEGHDEESRLIMGVDKDFAAILALAVGGYFIAKSKQSNGAQPYARYIKHSAMGALAAWAGRFSYDYAMTRGEKEKPRPRDHK